MAYPKGAPKVGGRQKGTPNKVTGTIREMIVTALNEAHEEGGVAYLKKQARDNPTAFLSLVGKVLPMQLGSDPENPLKVTLVKLVAPGHDDSDD